MEICLLITLTHTHTHTVAASTKLVVVEVLKDGPASRARPAIAAGDTLVFIDGRARTHVCVR